MVYVVVFLCPIVPVRFATREKIRIKESRRSRDFVDYDEFIRFLFRKATLEDFSFSEIGLFVFYEFVIQLSIKRRPRSKSLFSRDQSLSSKEQ